MGPEQGLPIGNRISRLSDQQSLLLPVSSVLVCLWLILVGGCGSLQPPSSPSQHPSVKPLLFPGAWTVEAAVRAGRRRCRLPCVPASPCLSLALPPLHHPRSSLSAPNHESAADAMWQIRSPPSTSAQSDRSALFTDHRMREVSYSLHPPHHTPVMASSRQYLV